MLIKHFINNKYDFDNIVINIILDKVGNILQNKQNVFFALSGGNTPKIYLSHFFNSEKLPFKKIKFFLVDERCVPENSSDSNFNLIKNIILNSKNSTDISFCKFINEVPDIAFFGIGDDFHIASIFCNKTLKSESNEIYIKENNPPKHIQYKRISLSPNTIRKIQNPTIFITKEKFDLLYLNNYRSSSDIKKPLDLIACNKESNLFIINNIL